MSDNHEGIIVILSSPSGAGKTSLVKEISLKNKYLISISHTTRKPRANEIDSIDYFFINEEKFKSLISKKKFLEYAKVFNNYYGSSEDVVFEKLDKGQNVIFDIDWQGTEQIIKRKLNYKLISIFILPPSKKVLFERLSNRDMKDKLIVEERMKQFNKDIEHWENYDFVVVNEDLEKCYKEIIEFINERIKNIDNKYDKNNILNHIKKLRI